MKLRVDPYGVVRGLWTDTVDWRSLGTLSVQRASHVEFEAASQSWIVIAARACRTLQAGSESAPAILFRSPAHPRVAECHPNAS